MRKGLRLRALRVRSKQVRVLNQYTVQRVGELGKGGRITINGNRRTSEKKGYGTLPVVARRQLQGKAGQHG